MRVEHGTPVPQPDTIFYDVDDYLTGDPILCASCLIAFFDTKITPRIGHKQHGKSEQALGARIVLPSGNSLMWRTGDTLPSGTTFIVEILRIFGRDARIEDYSRAPLPLFADTVVSGTAYCHTCFYTPYESVRKK